MKTFTVPDYHTGQPIDVARRVAKGVMGPAVRFDLVEITMDEVPRLIEWLRRAEREGA